MSARALGPDEPATLTGRTCENDEMGDYELPRDLAAGDLLAMRTTGAYTYSMASNYNRFGRPPVVFVRDGHHRRVVRGEPPRRRYAARRGGTPITGAAPPHGDFRRPVVIVLDRTYTTDIGPLTVLETSRWRALHPGDAN